MRNQAIIAALAVALLMTPAFADPAHARVSALAGDGLVRGSAEGDWSYVALNTLILEGDTVWADDGGMLEVEFPGGTFLRLADGSKAEVARVSAAPEVRGWYGSFYLQRLRRGNGEARFVTPACTVHVAPDSLVRVDIRDSGATTVSARWGRARVATAQGGSALLDDGQRTFVDPGYLPSHPAYYDRTAEDALDVWSRERGQRLAGVAEAPVAALRSGPVGAHDLAAHGDWVRFEGQQYWKPTVVDVDFVPYRDGRWSYTAPYGYVWVGDYPFCYVTSHYGRWKHHPVHGWVWRYRDGWGPAWCTTYRVGPYFVWSPLDPYDRPVNYGHASFTVGGVRIDIGASSYCHADRLLTGAALVHPATPTVINQTVVNGDVHIWNIGNAVAVHDRVHGDRPALTVRDYAPRRVIRGDATRRTGVAARARAVTLEDGVGRSRFEPVTRARSVRTTMRADGRDASVRRVSSEGVNVPRAPKRFERIQRPAGATVSGAPASRHEPAAEARGMRTVRQAPETPRHRTGTTDESARSRFRVLDDTRNDLRDRGGRNSLRTRTSGGEHHERRAVRSRAQAVRTPVVQRERTAPVRGDREPAVSRDRAPGVSRDRSPSRGVTRFERGRSTAPANTPQRSESRNRFTTRTRDSRAEGVDRRTEHPSTRSRFRASSPQPDPDSRIRRFDRR